MSDLNQPTDFDINDPGLDSYAPDLDPNAPPEQLRPAPIDDGVHWLILKPNTRRQGGPVYFKDIVKNAAGEVVDGKVIAALSVRAENEEGAEGQFLKDFYATSVAMGPKKGSSLTYILAQAGDPIRAGSSLRRIKEHTERVLAEKAETGIRVLAKTRWLRSVPQSDDSSGTPLYVFDEFNRKMYTEVKGQEKIIALEVEKSKQEVLYWTAGDSETAEEFEARKQQHIDTAPARAHIWYDPVSGDERSVSAEIQSLENPSMYTSA